jgi:Hemerythrin HHE cation binding domain
LTAWDVTKGEQIMEFNIPSPLKGEHEELHEELARATKVAGNIGEAARAVAQILHLHFVKEEEYALPPLGLLPRLATGDVTPEMADVLVLTERLKAELPQMLEEHKAIVAALSHLVEVAKQEHKLEYAHFAEKLTLHAQTEEEVLYPTATMIGEYLKLILKR